LHLVVRNDFKKWYFQFRQCRSLWIFFRKLTVKKLNYNLNILQIDYAEETVAIQEIIFEDNKFINQYTPIYGDIEFTHYKIIENSSEWEKVEKYSSRQDEFVELLKTGEFADLDGEIHKIC